MWVKMIINTLTTKRCVEFVGDKRKSSLNRPEQNSEAFNYSFNIYIYNTSVNISILL